MQIVILLIIGTVFGAISSAIASSKGRNAVGWFFFGFGMGVGCSVILGWLPIVLALVLPNLKEEESRRQAMLTEQRRLREQLRQEQLKAESYRQFTYARLDAHDQALGIDTRNQPQLGADANAPQYLPVAPEDPAAALSRMTDPAGVTREVAGDGNGATWFYERSGQSVGPVSAMSLRSLLTSGQIGGETLVWCPGFTDWTPAAQVDEFRAA